MQQQDIYGQHGQAQDYSAMVTAHNNTEAVTERCHNTVDMFERHAGAQQPVSEAALQERKDG